MFDAIVVGSGMSGGIPEEELARDYPIQRQCYAVSTATQQYWVKDSEHPYETPEGKPFSWIRGYHLGGRSIMWGRQTYRMSEMDFQANALDGHGSDWPIRYADLAPWYDHIERFIGVSGSSEGLDQLPDGQFLPAMPMNDAEKLFKAKVEQAFPDRKVIIGRCAHLTETRPHHEELGRNPCQYRSLCERGCSYGAYHSSLSSSLPAAERTGNLTIVTDAIVHSVITDPRTGKATGVRVIDQNTREARTYDSRIVFLCASTIGTAQILLNSRSDANPRGLANSSDMVGRNLMDHIYGVGVSGTVQGPDTYYRGRRPNGLYIPRFYNLPGKQSEVDFIRGFGFQGAMQRVNWRQMATSQPGVGEELKARVRKPGPWMAFFGGFGEMLPNPDNRVTLYASKVDKWGIPLVNIDCTHGENEKKIVSRILVDGKAMLEAVGATNIQVRDKINPPGLGIHEMGTACMGKDPRKSVLNGYNQAHDVPNLFITDGAAMASSGCQNPSLTYMALSARAAFHASEVLKAGSI
ncbi:GMC oxidoreductase [Novosphingobium sp. B1]|uniref:GMC oxidoreductase n=1 Tax=Novosphingobium sp. B1 TaxID=1938756 RepID=UPI0009D88010|nr:GMC family oxidoreductase [Novosphingobium sp. B1]SMD08013.1 Choline dehydrogenase [Novosphingobium sp. B1]